MTNRANGRDRRRNDLNANALSAAGMLTTRCLYFPDIVSFVSKASCAIVAVVSGFIIHKAFGT